MARPVPEWVGETETSKVPERVWLRVLEKFSWKCQQCFRDAALVKRLECDHIVALINWTKEGHGHRESNLQPLCDACHARKTKLDVAKKALASRRKKMRPAYKREENPYSFKARRERLKLKFNWKTGRYERQD
ncbi:MAG TPA: HNH endonuclease signature motif containing protein [Candidatus Paceibacterota bacterium]